MKKNIFTLALFSALALAQPLWAAEEVASRMDRIEKRMMALEHKTFAGGKTDAEGASTGDAADLEARLGAMEEENAKLYGSVEELGKAVEQLAKKIDLIVKDMDLRLQDLEKKSKAQ